LAGGILAPVASAKTAHVNAGPNATQHIQRAQFTRGFDVKNETEWPLKFYQLTLDKDNAEPGDVDHPPLGTVIQPGQSMHFELTYRWFNNTKAWVDFRALDPNGQPIPHKGWEAGLLVTEMLGDSYVLSWVGDHRGEFVSGNSVTFISYAR